MKRLPRSFVFVGIVCPECCARDVSKYLNDLDLGPKILGATLACKAPLALVRCFIIAKQRCFCMSSQAAEPLSQRGLTRFQLSQMLEEKMKSFRDVRARLKGVLERKPRILPPVKVFYVIKSGYGVWGGIIRADWSPVFKRVAKT